MRRSVLMFIQLQAYLRQIDLRNYLRQWHQWTIFSGPESCKSTSQSCSARTIAQLKRARASRKIGEN
uniref:Uncharacterized protein n=1 Tax=Romanomermis culicivorax TaxID=13658 RepID=A0A915HMF5_ROMCU